MCDTELHRVVLRAPRVVVPRATTVPAPGRVTAEVMTTERRVYDGRVDRTVSDRLWAAGALGRGATTI